MYLNNFSVRVVGGHEVANGYVEMQHGRTYMLMLRNDRDVRCDARVEIDGQHVGTFRIAAHANIQIEHPVEDQGKFTFYELGTREAHQAKLVDDATLGLISVTFTPEQAPSINYMIHTYPERKTWKRDKWIQTPYVTWDEHTMYTASDSDVDVYTTGNTSCRAGLASAACVAEHASGGTGLSGHSNQEYCDAAWITYDYTQRTTINLRLVGVRHTNEPRPLTTRANPIPPRI